MRKIDPVLPPPPPNFPYLFFSLNPSLPFLILPMTRRDSSPARPPVTDQNITGLNQPAQSRQSEHKHIFQLFRIPIITIILPFISEVEEVVAVVVIVRIASDLVWFLVRLWHTLNTDCICYEFDWNYFLISSCGPYWLHSWVFIKQKTNNNRTSKVF